MKITLSLQKKILGFALLSAIAVNLPLTAQSPTFAQRARNSLETANLKPIVFAAPDLSGRGRPGDRRGGASRGECLRRGQARELVAFIPDTDSNPSIGLTTEEHPTFWFHVPYTAKDFSTLEFTLKDEEDREVYTTQLTGLSNLPGIVSFRLPESVAPLAPEKTYLWSIEARCQETSSRPEDASRAVAIGASIIRVAIPTDVARELKEARTARERALIYARNGIWYDTLTEIGNLQRAGEARDDWENLLETLELQEFAKRRFANCCQVASEKGWKHE